MPHPESCAPRAIFVRPPGTATAATAMDLPADPITLLSVGIAGLMIVACVGGCLYYTIWVKCLEPRWREIRVTYLVPCWISTRRGCIRPCRAGTEGCLSTM